MLPMTSFGCVFIAHCLEKQGDLGGSLLLFVTALLMICCRCEYLYTYFLEFAIVCNVK